MAKIKFGPRVEVISAGLSGPKHTHEWKLKNSKYWGIIYQCKDPKCQAKVRNLA